jgi:hypothetical protein
MNTILDKIPNTRSGIIVFIEYVASTMTEAKADPALPI